MAKYNGVYAALLVPRSSTGSLDIENFEYQIDSLSQMGMSGYAINGATGEFPFSTPDELEEMLRVARKRSPSKCLLAGIAAGDVRGAVLRGKIAVENGADAVLLPMPGFFSYRQDDLHTFCLSVADELKLPVLLYNLPQFTNGLDVETAVSLLQRHPNIVGVKDSSGSLNIVRAITDANLDVARIIGNDSVLCSALEQGLCDAVVSGVACALPELIARIFGAGPVGQDFAYDRSLLEEFIAHISQLPTPWGLKVASEVRGFVKASYPFPLSSERGFETAALQTWFRGWASEAISDRKVRS